jgi:hypothetical protein
MRPAIYASWLVFKNNVDQVGLGSYLLKIGPLAFLNIILLSFLFSTTRTAEFTVALIMNQYIYFIPLLALSAGIGTWETELFEGVGEMYILYPRLVMISRLIQVLVEMLTPCGFFIALLLYGGGTSTDALTVLGMAGAYSLTGVGLGVFAGMKTEKSINNMLNLIIWVLGFGPGPFLGESVHPYQFFFPGFHALQGNYVQEWLVLTVYLLVGLFLIRLARLPRRFRVYAR